MKILSSTIEHTYAEYEISLEDSVYVFCLSFELVETYSNHFNPGRFLGYFQKPSGKVPEDIRIDSIYIKKDGVYFLKVHSEIVPAIGSEMFEEISEKLQEHLLENYESK